MTSTSGTSEEFELWRRCVRHWFPRLLERTYFVPPVHMNRVQYENKRFSGLDLDVEVACPPVNVLPRGARPVLLESQAREDQTQQRLLRCLEALADNLDEVMVVVSQLQFGDYLGNPSYAAGAASFPRAVDLKGEQKHRGDFDLLIISRRCGLIVAEMKSIGDKFALLGMVEEKQDELVAKKVQLARKQLDKASDVLTHLVSDLQRPPGVHKVLAMPNVSKLQMQRVLENQPDLTRDLKQCLRVREPLDLLDAVLCADHLSDLEAPWELPAHVLAKLTDWWLNLTSSFTPECFVDDSLYEELVVRFSGPATTVNVYCTSEPRVHLRSKAHGVWETGERFTRLVLYPDQVQILGLTEPLVYVTGPPGTGKTVVLTLRAVHWLRQHLHVHIASTSCDSLAASWLIHNQVRHMVSEELASRLHFHSLDLDKGPDLVQQAAETLVGASEEGQLFVIADEVFVGSPFKDWCAKLASELPRLHLWAASVWHGDRPECLVEARLAFPHRAPPAIARQVQKSCWMGSIQNVRPYTETAIPNPCEGAKPWILRHEGPGHEQLAGECVSCGFMIADVLLDELHVGQSQGPAAAVLSSPPALCFRDVFLLTWGLVSLHDQLLDGSGAVTQQASGVIRGLRMRGVPVRVLAGDNMQALREVAEMGGPDCVVAAQLRTISGLERKVVVYVQASRLDDDVGRLEGMSRATAQLIWVLPPDVTCTD